MTKIKAVIFPYVNSEPIRLALSNICEIIREVPSKILNIVESEDPDIVLTPITYVQELLNRNYLPSNIVIASGRVVRSVCILYNSNIPLTSVKEIYVTDESSVSVRVLRHILFKKNISARIVSTKITLENYSDIIKKGPILAIGDLALILRRKLVTILDVGREWYRLYKKPLIFSILLHKKNFKVIRILKRLTRLLSDIQYLASVAKSSNHYVKSILGEKILEVYFRSNIKYIVNNALVYARFILSKVSGPS